MKSKDGSLWRSRYLKIKEQLHVTCFRLTPQEDTAFSEFLGAHTIPTRGRRIISGHKLAHVYLCVCVCVCACANVYVGVQISSGP